MTASEGVWSKTHEELTNQTRVIVSGLFGEAALAGMHDDVVLEEPDFLPYGGTHHGVEGFRDVMVGASQILDLSRTTLDGVLADGEHAVRFLRVTLRDTDEEVAVAEEIRLREGKVASVRVFWFDHHAH